MKKTKLFIVVLLVALVAMGSVFAAGSAESAAKGQVLRVAAFKGAYGDAFWAPLVAEFEAQNPGVTVEIEASPNLEDVIRPQIMTGEGPDVIYLATGREKALTETLMADRAMVDLTDLLDTQVPGENATLREKILPGFLDTNATNPYGDGRTYLLPLFYSANGLFYNADLFNADGSDGKYKLPETWADFLALKGELDKFNAGKNDAEKRYLLSYARAGYMDNFIIAAVASSAGIDVMNEFLNYEDVYGNPEFVRVFEAMADIKGNFYMPAVDNATPYLDNQNALLQNRALFLPCGSWIFGEMADYTPAAGFKYGYTAPFAFEHGDDRYAVAMMEQVYVLKQSKNQDLAKKFLAFLYSDKAVEIIARDAQGIVPTVNAVEIARSTGAMDDQSLSVYEIFSTGVKPAIGQFASASVENVNWKQTFCFTMNACMKGEKTAADWVNAMKADASKLRAALN